MSARARLSDLSLSAVIAGFIAVLVGYTSTAAIIFQAAAAAWQGDITMGAQPLHIATPQWITPRFNFTSLMGIALPFFIVTMASQNAPGVATLQAAGYPAPVSPLVAWTALASLVLAPFGGFSICIAAICLSPEAHPNPARRYLAAAAAGGFYLLTGLFGGSIGQLFSALPAAQSVIALPAPRRRRPPAPAAGVYVQPPNDSPTACRRCGPPGDRG